MILGRKGQGEWKWIVPVVAVSVLTVAILYIWSWVNQQNFPTSPEQYAEAWKDYGELAFDMSKGDQPWRVVSVFFFPLMVYFSLFFAAICLVFAKGNLVGWSIIQRPFIIFTFAVSFLILPFPTTYFLYQSLGGISIFVIIFSWLAMIGFIIIILRHMSTHFGGPSAPGAPGAPRGPSAPGAPGAPALPAVVNVNLMNASNDLRQFAIALANLRRTS